MAASVLSGDNMRMMRQRLLRKKPMNDVAEEAPLTSSSKFNKSVLSCHQHPSLARVTYSKQAEVNYGIDPDFG